MTATATQRKRAKQRAKVRLLAAQGVSNRVIASRTGVSEATVRRWRKADALVTHPAASTDALTVVLDEELRYHLGLLAEAGHDPQEAIGKAVAFLSDAYAYAWDYGVNERGTVPELRVRVKGDPWPPVTSW